MNKDRRKDRVIASGVETSFRLARLCRINLGNKYGIIPVETSRRLYPTGMVNNDARKDRLIT